jgi:excisionase family DNA binding protein
MATEAQEPYYLRPDRAAQALGVSRAQLYRWLAAGVIESKLVGRVRLVPVAALKALRSDDDDNRAAPAA